jgi:signal transduction histidine kinase
MTNVAHLPTASARRSRRDAAPDNQKRSFLRMVSHELRTPLNSILGFSEILAAELYGPHGAPQYKEYAEIIRGSGQKLLKMVNQVLEIARLESDANDLEVRPESLDSAIEDVIASLGEDLAGHSIRVSVGRRGELPLVMADPRGLRTVLSNLLHNAITYSPANGEVRISAVARGRTVELAIEDDGPGVQGADLARMLRPFEQGEDALTRRGEGAGLGLPICELTCRAMHGRLRLTCEPGHGLRACVQLRAA